jgi:23S rRNA pseudouridine1911/1915/1917 synthase
MIGTDLKIIYEDNHVIAVEKQAGTLIQQDSSGEPSLLDHVREYIRERYSKPGNVFCGLVHRLDRQVSGVVVFAKTSKAAQRLHAEFAGRSVQKLYIALVENKKTIEQGRWIEREDLLVRKRGFSERADGKSRNVINASMRYMAVASNDRYVLLLVQLLTGRKHQIRAQLAAMEIPVVGDATYGSTETLPGGSICLHAYWLEFAHPTKKETVRLVSPVPERIAVRLPVDETALRRAIESPDTM